MNREKFIIEKGNALFYGIMFLFVCITITICFCLRNRDIEQVRLFLLCLNIFSLSIMVPYRIYLVFDKEYMNSVYADVRKAYLFELPFFPCNTAEILFSAAIFFNIKTFIELLITNISNSDKLSTKETAKEPNKIPPINLLHLKILIIFEISIKMIRKIIR